MESVPSIGELLTTVRALQGAVTTEAEELFNGWRGLITRADFEASAENLACYLALRRHELPSLQRGLTRWGLSSLGRCESRVRASLESVVALLGAATGAEPLPAYPAESAFFRGAEALEQAAASLFGKPGVGRRSRIMVTLPSEAAEDAAWLRELVLSGVDCVRINCAHDDADVWSGMLRNLRSAERELGQKVPLRVLMDLGGPKVRTTRPPKSEARRHVAGDLLLLTPASELKRVYKRQGRRGGRELPVVGCTLPEALSALDVGQTVYVDDGKIRARAVERVPDGVVLEVVRAPARGSKIRSGKGLNFPDTEFLVEPLTPMDRAALPFVVANADMLGYSFVQTKADVDVLLSELSEHMPPGRKGPAIVLKIETRKAVSNLPELIVHAAGRLPTAVMIARGDLAIEIGFERIAEMQEEILWLCEAASVPVIWATQVLEDLAKEGVPTRAEVTDAAMANRAECVMLNKGPHILEAVGMLDSVLSRMDAHQHKKTPRLRSLRSW